MMTTHNGDAGGSNSPANQEKACGGSQTEEREGHTQPSEARSLQCSLAPRFLHFLQRGETSSNISLKPGGLWEKLSSF